MIRKIQETPEKSVIPEFTPRRVEVVMFEGKGGGVRILEDCPADQPIMRLSGELVNSELADPYSLQIDEDLFISLMNGVMETDDYLNHSCQPNCVVRFPGPTAAPVPILFSLRSLKEGEELTINYNATEIDMIAVGEDFACACGTSDCQGMIGGFSHLSSDHQQKIAHLLSPFLTKKLEKTLAKTLHR